MLAFAATAQRHSAAAAPKSFVFMVMPPKRQRCSFHLRRIGAKVQLLTPASRALCTLELEATFPGVGLKAT